MKGHFMNTDLEQRKHLHKIVSKSHSGFLVTRNDRGMHGRPMATAQADEQMTQLWFATKRTHAKIKEIQADDRVMIGYTSADGTEWASINGRARIVDDRGKMRELWSPFWRTWLDGPDDPEMILIEVTPESAEFWDMGNKLVALVKFAVGTITGKDTTAGGHQQMRL
jgi:general stress protein 26